MLATLHDCKAILAIPVGFLCMSTNCASHEGRQHCYLLFAKLLMRLHACAGTFGSWASFQIVSRSLVWSRESFPLVHQAYDVKQASLASPSARRSLRAQLAQPLCLAVCSNPVACNDIYAVLDYFHACNAGRPSLRRRPSALIRMWPMG